MSLKVLLYHLESMVGGRALGWAVLAALGCVCAAALWLLGAVLLGASRRKALVATWLSSAMLTAFVGVRVQLEDAEILRLLLNDPQAPDSATRWRLLGEAWSRLLHTLIWPPLLLAPVALVVVIGLLWHRERNRARGLGAVTALLVAVSVWSVYRAHRAFFISSGCDHECQYEQLAYSAAAIHSGKVYVAIAALLGCAWLLRMTYKRRSHDVASRSLMLTGCLLLLTGGAAELGVSARRHDTARPVPFDDGSGWCAGSSELRRTLPKAPPDCVTFEAPYFEVRRDGARIDGALVTSLEDIRANLENKRKIWLEINPEKAFSGAVMLAAERQASTRDLLPWLAVVRDAGYPKVGAYVEAPAQNVNTETLGVIHKQRCCLAPFMIDDAAGTSLSSFDDWDSVVHATSAASLHVALR